MLPELSLYLSDGLTDGKVDKNALCTKIRTLPKDIIPENLFTLSKQVCPCVLCDGLKLD